MTERVILFEVMYEDVVDEDEECVEVHRYYEDGVAEMLHDSDGSDSTIFVWRVKDGRVQYWQDGLLQWTDDNEQVQQEWQAWLSKQITT